VIALSRDDYSGMLDDAAASGIVGGATYDAIIAKAAELAQVDHLLTLNESDFRRINAKTAARVASPHALSPPNAGNQP
jgi:hypothetical protein